MADVSIIIPCFNAEAWIAKTIDSVLAQTGPRIELIVVDDGSQDGSVDVLRRYGIRIRVVTGPSRGACHARNRGLALGTARYVLFLDADDYFEGQVLTGCIAAADAHRADIALANMVVEDQDGRRKVPAAYRDDVAPETFYEGWLRGAYVNPSAILWRTETVRMLGGWDESLWRNQDFDITLRALLTRPKIVASNTGRVVHTRVNPGSISQTMTARAIDSRRRAYRKILHLADGTAFARFNPLLERELYTIARTAFSHGHINVGRSALADLQARGNRRNPGTLAHRVATSLIGLERKVHLSRWLSRGLGRA